MTTAKKLLTAEEFFRLPDDGRRLELVDGEIIELPPNNFGHGEVTFNLGAALDGYARPRGLGRVSVGDPGFVIRKDPDRVRAPDVAFFTTDRVPPQEQRVQGFLSVMPDLVAEVVSPGDIAAEVETKVGEWLAAGVRLVLVVYPRTRSVTAYRSATDVYRYTAADTLDAEPVLPGFACPVASLFE